jgi:DNA (cytosine-5)-methyltransferase 1
MSTKENISIKEFDSKSYQTRYAESNEDEKAILTHYFHNIHNGVSKHYKKDALKVLKNYVDYKQENHFSIAKDDVIQQLLFEVENVPFPTPQNYTFKFIDLFAGIGGFRLAMQNAGGKCIYTSEWNNDAKITYRENFGETPFGDITKESVKKRIPNETIDVLCAGFPCQAFSIAGYQKGFADTRGTLFFDIEQIIDKHRPKVVFLENVKNLVSHDKGNTFKVIIEILEEKLGYKVYNKVLNSMTHGNVPQNRERIFIIAFDPNQVINYRNFRFPKEIRLTKTIHDFLEMSKQDDKYYYPKNHRYFNELAKTIIKKDTVYQWRRVYVRENKSNVCPTLTANMGTGGHNVPLIRDNYGIRKLTPKECFAFQGYPMDKFILPSISDSKLYMQAGNSVTVSLIERISNEIIKVF